MNPSPTDQHHGTAGSTDDLPAGLADQMRSASAGVPTEKPQPPKERHGTGKPVPSASARGLSRNQKGILCQHAAAAYRLQSDLGLVGDDITLETWRRQQAEDLIGVTIREAEQRHYTKLRGHFQALASRTPSASNFADMTTPDDEVDRQTVSAEILRGLAKLSQTSRTGDAMGAEAAERYLLALAKGKSGGRDQRSLHSVLRTWPIKRLWDLLYTLRNRCAAMTGKGSTANRNKSQRR